MSTPSSPTARRLWDISPPVHAGSPVFPGDTAYSQQWCATIGPGCPVNVSAITMSPHVGAHADAPLHYDAQGATIGDVSLDAFLGPCRVIHAIGCGPLITWEHIAHAVSSPLPPRVLILRSLLDGLKMRQVRHPDIDPALLREALSVALRGLRVEH